jgi:hypothetical protein
MKLMRMLRAFSLLHPLGLESVCVDMNVHLGSLIQLVVYLMVMYFYSLLALTQYQFGVLMSVIYFLKCEQFFILRYIIYSNQC